MTEIIKLSLKKILAIFALIFLFALFASPFFIASGVYGEESVTGGSFQLLENYGQYAPDLEELEGYVKEGKSSEALASYINFIVKLSFGLGSIAAVVLIIWGGVEYVTAESFSGKTGGKDRIVKAFGALIILFSAFIFFNTINPELLKVRFEPAGIVTSGGGEARPSGETCEDEVRNRLAAYTEKLRLEKPGYRTKSLNTLNDCNILLNSFKDRKQIIHPDGCKVFEPNTDYYSDCSNASSFYAFGERDREVVHGQCDVTKKYSCKIGKVENEKEIDQKNAILYTWNCVPEKGNSPSCSFAESK